MEAIASQLQLMYQKIAVHISSMIPTEWNKVYYLGEIEMGKLSWSSVFYFEDAVTKEIIKSHDIPEIYSVSASIYDDLLIELNEILLEIYHCFEENQLDLWEQLSLTLNSSGSCTVDYFYDKMHSNDGGQINREVIWAYETFKLVPKEGTYSNKLLNKYLLENKKW